ncbi:uncharacterized protein LOC111341068 [Stylophora pistillata]|uniref:uncharacterized protein LOC111341068 n=1 Tax=Stylophora pistillata TaxID=50429 RepID=UPI000C0565CD|nr:uncharacterized protein LOC111341068 [Stylophora pistillata]
MTNTFSTTLNKPSFDLQVNVGFRTAVNTSSVANQTCNAAFAIDNNLATCFSSNKELDPWIRVGLPGDLFIYKVLINDSHFHGSGELYQVQVLTPNRKDTPVKCYRNNKSAGLVFDCVPPVKGMAVQVSKEGNCTLTVCELHISGIDSKSDGNGVMRELWTISNSDDYELTETDEETVSGWHFIKTLDAPSEYGFGYVQKLTTYLQIKQGGNFTFYLTCAERCELWLETVNDLNPSMDLDQTILVQLKESTKDWNSRPIDQSSGFGYLSECYFYKMEVFMSNDFSSHDHLAVGVMLPNGTEQKPMSGNNLYWMKPGETTLEIQLSDPSEDTFTEVGSNFTVTGSYKYCCHGVFCPSCKLVLRLLVLNEEFLLNSSLSMTCEEILFQFKIEVGVDPGVYEILANYSLVENDRDLSPMEKPLANVTVEAAVLVNCTSPNSLCNWTTNATEGNIRNGGVFHFRSRRNGDGKNFWLQSTPLPWKQAYSKVPTCLQFKYNTSSTNRSYFYLKVFVIRPNGMELPLWSIKVEQGNKSTSAQVSWESEQNITIRFEGMVLERGQMTIYDVIVKTLECQLQPINATVERTHCYHDLRQVKFCNECIDSKKLCDGTKDCADGSDELQHCKLREKKQFQCLYGSFIPWSKTCLESDDCQDNTHKPSICESYECPLNDLSCKNPGNPGDSSKRTNCVRKGDKEWRISCNLRKRISSHDGFQERRRSLNFGKRISTHDGFQERRRSWNFIKRISIHDRFQAKNPGNFIYFIGANSTRNISTDLIKPSNSWKCMRFWYYIRKNLKTSSLSYKIEVLLLNFCPNTTKMSKELLSISDNRANQWIFVQLPLALDKDSDAPFKISFRGTVQSSGNVKFAIDGVSLSPEKCEKIPFTSKQNGCDNCEKLEHWNSTSGNATWRLVSSSEVKTLLENVKGSSPRNQLSAVRVLLFNATCTRISVEKWLQEDLTQGTLCMWIRTKFSGLQLEYRQNTEEFQGKTSLQLVFHDTLLKISLHRKEWNISTSVIDDKWHHVCASWKVPRSGRLRIYIDGQIKLERDVRVKNPVTGKGNLNLELKKETTSNGTNGYISGLNVWDHMLESQEIWRMSLGCANETGNAEAWARFQSYLSYSPHDQCSVTQIEKALSCQDRENERMILDTSGGQAELKSPWFNRSDVWHGKCVKFRFMLVGYGNQSLHFIQNVAQDLESPPIWAARNTDSSQLWQYGQVSITGTARHQLSFRGEMEAGDDGSMAIHIGGLYIVPGYCEILPHDQMQGIRREVSQDKTTGWIFSPQYPGYYTNDAYYKWTLAAPPGHIIKLEFVYFDLENSSSCSHDFLEVKEPHNTHGPFCGQSNPAVIKSERRWMILLFKSNEKVAGGGFKANYTAIQVANIYHENGCPENCNCSKTAVDLKLVVRCNGPLLEFPMLPNDTTVLQLSHTSISELEAWHFQYDTNAKQHLELVDLSYNKILYIQGSVFHNMPSLRTLRLNGNFIQNISTDTLCGLGALQTLDLGDNLLSKLDGNPFGNLTNLSILSLRSNKIETVDGLSFSNTSKLTHLYLQDNKISHIEDGLFQALSSLKVLYLNSNQLKTLTSFTFDGLGKLETLYLQNNSLDERSPQDVFEKVKNLKILKTDKFILCCYAKKAIKNLDCTSTDDNDFSSCDDMMKYPSIRVCLWVLGIVATCGNLIVLIWRVLVPDNNPVQSLLLSNLAMADFLMGVYLLTLAVLDIKWKGEYFMHDVSWRNSRACRIVGAISMLSSEVSVAMLTITTADRLICVVFALKFERMTLKSAYVVCLCVWVMGVVISIIPILDIEYFHGNSSNGISLFSQSAVCLPFQLSSKKPSGWEYLMAIFIIFNFCSFVFILVAYMAIYWTMMKLVSGSASAHMQRESAQANRLFIIVLTDFFCWMPIIIMGILSLTNTTDFSDLTGLVYVWVAVFVLPLNSSVNPVLYTLTTSNVKAKLMSVLSKFSICNKQDQGNNQNLE